MTWVDDVRSSARALARHRRFVAGVLVVLALGIGLATAVFTVADAVLIRRLAVHDQDALVLLRGERRDGTGGHYPLGLEQSRIFAERTRALSATALASYYGAAAQVIRDGGQLTRMRSALVSGNFFDVLGAQPVLGRLLTPGDDAAGVPPTAVLSYAAWQNRFGGDSGVIGRKLVTHVDGASYTIVGVVTRGVDYPRGTEFWSPIRAVASDSAQQQYVVVNLVGRLAAGSSPRAASEELSAFFASPDASRWQRDLRGSARGLADEILGETDDALLVLAAAAGLLLLITCVNIAHLLLARGLARSGEVAVRAALGAGRARIVRQLVFENVLLAIAGGIAALPVAAAAVQAFVAFAPAQLPRIDEIALNVTVLVAAGAITGIAVLVFGLAPAWISSRPGSTEVLRSGARQSGARGARRSNELLVVAQVAIAFVVLCAATLMARSLIALQREDLAFDPSRMLVAELALSTGAYDTPQRQMAMLDQLVPRIDALPGIRAVTPVVAVPFSGTHGWDGRFQSEGQSTQDAAAAPMLNMEVVAPAYFSAFGVPIVQGRAFTDDDRSGATPVIIVSESTARLYWPGENPLGRRLFLGSPDRSVTVVGVVPDTRYRELREARASVYFPMRQSFFPFAPNALMIRGDAAAANVAAMLRQLMEADFPGVALAAITPFEDFLGQRLAQPRLNAFLLMVFAGVALTLAAVGLFGIMMLTVRQRLREIGVRIAVGATPGAIRSMVLQRGIVLAVTGSVLGLTAALLLNRALAALLYGVGPNDPVTLTFVAGFVLAVAVLATAVPARFAARVSPMRALASDGA